jgi:hypothetical protein
VQAVDVHRLPVMPMNAEREPLLSPRGMHHDCPPILGQFDYAVPHQVTDPRGEHSYEDSRANLEQPSREMSSQAGRAGAQDQDYHGTSKSSEL